ncbi:hypothetical protein Tsubulata_018321, partial [Turnera subulata]
AATSSLQQSHQQDHRNQELQEPHGLINFDNNKLELMDLSLGNSSSNEAGDNTTSAAAAAAAAAGGPSTSSTGPIEKEHMFDKVVTPSDVGKLNRLVIPKQHAERFFPLDSSSNEKGLLLNFEDRSGKPWRFRYSYWNSSQSYVMTKGWSRFVKEKKLDAGDIVSFQRGVGEEGKHRLFIDWRRRPNAPDPASSYGSHFEAQNRLQFPGQSTSVRWGGGGGGGGGGGEDHVAPVVIDSVPVVHGKTVGKRLRLFGVNMECPITQDDHHHQHHHQYSSSSSPSFTHATAVESSPYTPHFASSSLPPVQLRVSDDQDASTPTMQAHEFSKKGKTSLSFDLDV